MIGGNLLCWTLKLTDNFDGPENDWSWVIRIFLVLLPEVSNKDCCMHPKGAKEAFGRKWRAVTGRGRAKPLSTSSLIISRRTWWFFEADLWFPLFEWKTKSVCLSESEISSSGKVAPWSRISFRRRQRGCWDKRSSICAEGRNSKP